MKSLFRWFRYRHAARLRRENLMLRRQIDRLSHARNRDRETIELLREQVTVLRTVLSAVQTNSELEAKYSAYQIAELESLKGKRNAANARG